MLFTDFLQKKYGFGREFKKNFVLRSGINTNCLTRIYLSPGMRMASRCPINYVLPCVGDTVIDTCRARSEFVPGKISLDVLFFLIDVRKLDTTVVLNTAREHTVCPSGIAASLKQDNLLQTFEDWQSTDSDSDNKKPP